MGVVGFGVVWLFICLCWCVVLVLLCIGLSVVLHCFSGLAMACL